jgi:hypothetical protein
MRMTFPSSFGLHFDDECHLSNTRASIAFPTHGACSLKGAAADGGAGELAEALAVLVSPARAYSIRRSGNLSVRRSHEPLRHFPISCRD